MSHWSDGNQFCIKSRFDLGGKAVRDPKHESSLWTLLDNTPKLLGRRNNLCYNRGDSMFSALRFQCTFSGPERLNTKLVDSQSARASTRRHRASKLIEGRGTRSKINSERGQPAVLSSPESRIPLTELPAVPTPVCHDF